MTVREFGACLLILYVALQIYLLILYFEQAHNAVNGDINFDYLVKICLVNSQFFIFSFNLHICIYYIFHNASTNVTTIYECEEDTES